MNIRLHNKRILICLCFILLSLSIDVPSTAGSTAKILENLQFSVYTGFSGYANPLAFYALRLSEKNVPTSTTSFNDLGLTPLVLSVKNISNINIPLEVAIYNHSLPFGMKEEEAVSWLTRFLRLEEKGEEEAKGSAEEALQVVEGNTEKGRAGSSQREAESMPSPKGVREILAHNRFSLSTLHTTLVRREGIVARKKSQENFSFPLSVYATNPNQQTVGFTLDILFEGEIIHREKLVVKLLEPDSIYSLLLSEVDSKEILRSSKELSLATPVTKMLYRPVSIKHGIVTASLSKVGSNPDVFRHFQYVLIENAFWQSLESDDKSYLREVVASGARLVIFNSPESIIVDSKLFRPSKKLKLENFGFGGICVTPLNLQELQEEILEELLKRFNFAVKLYQKKAQEIPKDRAEYRLGLSSDEILLPGVNLVSSLDPTFLPVLLLWISNYQFLPDLFQLLEADSLQFKPGNPQEISSELARDSTNLTIPRIFYRTHYFPSVKSLIISVTQFSLLLFLILLLLLLRVRMALLVLMILILSIFSIFAIKLGIRAISPENVSAIILEFSQGSNLTRKNEIERLITLFSERRTSIDVELTGKDIALKSVTPITKQDFQMVVEQQSHATLQDIVLEPALPTQIAYRTKGASSPGIRIEEVNKQLGSYRISETRGEDVDRLFILRGSRLIDLGSLSAGKSLEIQFGKRKSNETAGDLILSSGSLEYLRAFTDAEKFRYLQRGSSTSALVLTTLLSTFTETLLPKLLAESGRELIISFRVGELKDETSTFGAGSVFGSVSIYLIE